MAAMRHGIHTVIIPKDNERDLNEIDPIVRKALNFVTAQSVDTVLETALNKVNEIVPTIIPEIHEDMKSVSRNRVIQQ